MRHVALVASIGILVTGGVARADDECPMDFTRAASGSWSTMVAEAIDACLDDPACAAGTMSQTEAEAMMMRPKPTRGPRGAFARGSATVGARARGLYGGGPAAGDAHLQVGAGGQAGWHRGPRVCGRTALDVGERTQGETALGIVFPHGFWSVGIAFTQDWEVQPRLSSPRRWLRRAYTSNRGEVGFAFATWRHRDGGVSSVIPIRMAGVWRGQSDAMVDTVLLQTMRGALYEGFDGDDRLEILPWSVESTELLGAPDPATPAEVAIDPTMTVPLRSRWLAQVGLVKLDRDLADGTRLDLAASMVWTSRPLVCRACQRFTGGVGIDVPRGGDRWNVRVDRSAFLAIDDVVTVEDRLSAGYARPRARHTLRATGFAAVTRTSALGPSLTPSTEPTTTGGVALALDLAVGQGFTMTTELEVARSFYARLDGSVAPIAEPAARLGVVLARHFGRGADGAH